MSEQTKSEEAEFEAFLKGQSELSDGYAQTKEAVPASGIDEAILAAARREVKSRPASSRPEPEYAGYQHYWKHGLSLAATLLLCVGLVSFYYQQSDEVMLRETNVLSEQAYIALDKERRQKPAVPPVPAARVPSAPAELADSVPEPTAEESQWATAEKTPTLAKKAQRQPPVASRSKDPLYENEQKRIRDEPAVAVQEDARVAAEAQQEELPMAVESSKRELADMRTRRSSVAESDADSFPAQVASQPLVSMDTKAKLKEQLEVQTLSATQPADAMAGLSSARHDQPQGRVMPEAEKLLLTIARYRALGQFNQADPLLRKFHRLFPQFPPQQRERMLDSLSPVKPEIKAEK